MPNRSFVIAAFAASAAFMAALAPAWGQQDDALFRNKQITILIGAGPAGGYDLSARILARHYGRYLPGNPSVVPKNLPGAGGLRLANQIYNVSPKDGTEIGLFATSTALEPLFGNKAAQYDTAKFTWLGNMDTNSAVGCGTWKHSGIKTWPDMKNRETTFGSAGPSAVSSIYPRMLAALLGLNTKVILGYTSTHNVIAAMERGELDGSCALNLKQIYLEFADRIEQGEMTIWINFGRERTQELPNTPTIFELLNNDDDLQLAQLIFGQNKVNRPFSAPPGIGERRTAALRAGFMATMADEQFLADAAKANVSVNPMSGEDTLTEYLSFYNAPKAVIERAIAIIGRTPEP